MIKVSYLMPIFSKKPVFIFEHSEEFLKRFTMSQWTEYELWLFRNRLFTIQKLKDLYSEAAAFKRKPIISIVMPVYNPDPVELRDAVNSILWQSYPYWELCIADDLSDNREYLKVLKKIKDRRIKIKLCDKHSGISETSQCALDMSSGQYIALMDQDDELYPDALFSFAKTIQDNDMDFFYSDMDKISPKGKRYLHFFKPGWSPEYLLSIPYISHIQIIDKKLLEEAGGFRKEYDGSQDYDLTLRVTERTDKIYHYPMSLYSYRQSRESIALNPDAKQYAYSSAINALKDACKRREMLVKDVVENRDIWRGNYRLVWDEERLDNESVYIITISDSSGQQQSLRKILEPCVNHFNVSWISSGNSPREIADACDGINREGYVFFCDDSILQMVQNGFLDMIGYLSIRGVGAVGSKFTGENNNILCCGISIADSGKWLLNYRGSPLSEHGYGAVASVPRNVALLYPAFWGSKTSYIKESGCFKGAENFYASILKFFRYLGGVGLRIVEVPYMNMKIDNRYAELFARVMDEYSIKWKNDGMRDIYYNPNLTDIYEDFGLKI